MSNLGQASVQNTQLSAELLLVLFLCMLAAKKWA